VRLLQIILVLLLCFCFFPLPSLSEPRESEEIDYFKDLVASFILSIEALEKGEATIKKQFEMTNLNVIKYKKKSIMELEHSAEKFHALEKESKELLATLVRLGTENKKLQKKLELIELRQEIQCVDQQELKTKGAS
jgi:hypothetical protein